MLYLRYHHLRFPVFLAFATLAWSQTAETGKVNVKPAAADPVLAAANALPLPTQPPAAPVAQDGNRSPSITDLPPNELFDLGGLPVPTEIPAPPPPEEEDEDEPSMADSLAVNLVSRMVQRGLLTEEDAKDLFRVAEADVAAAKAKRRARKAAAQEFAQQTGTGPGSGGEKIRVTYVPEIVKNELREQIKDELLLETKKGGVLSPTMGPEWVSSWRPFVDFRLRYEYLSFPEGNDVSGAFPNFNAINTGPPYDTSGVLFAPQYNADQDRDRVRMRLRLGTEVDLDDHFTLGVRVGTGDSNSPVSGNQSLGSTSAGPGGNFNQQGGQFSKYAIWLDRAFLKWEPIDSFAFTIGRFDNPFFSTAAIWSEDIGFDGIVLQSRYEVHDGLEPFLTLGTFPIFNTDLNFASNQPAKFESRNKWLHAGQTGVDWKISKDWHAKVAAAYYHFQNVEGVLSTPYAPRNAEDQGNTDHTRPSFAQRGNTYRPLRNIIADATNGFGTRNQFQYYGLATPFHVSAITARIDYNGFEPFQISLLAEYLQNHGFNKSTINSVAVNNLEAGAFEGGNKAWDVSLRFGKPVLEKRWDWMTYIGYTHRESDSVIDGFNDQNFGGGGTNLKGYSIGGAVSLSPRVNAALRWMSATQIAGPQFKLDILQFDINAKF